MAIPQLKRYTTPAGNLGLTNIPNYQPSTQPPVLRGGSTPQTRYAEQQQQMSNQSQLDAEMRASAENRAQNLAMFGGGASSFGRSQETQMLMDKAMSALGGTDVLQKKLAQKTIDQILGLESQSQTQQQSDVLDMQKARETLQMEQQSKLADLMAKREEIGQTRDFEREMLGAKTALEQQQLADKFGMDVALKKMELEAQKNAPPSEYQQARIEDIKFKQEQKLAEKELQKSEKASALQESMGAMQAQLAKLNRLSELQKQTETGWISGSDIGSAIRQIAPSNVLGGDRLRELEQGYKDLGINQMSAYKAGGVTFGAMSEDEWKMLDKVNASIKANEPVNQQILKDLRESLERRMQDNLKRAEKMGIDVKDYRGGQQQGQEQTQPQTLDDIRKLYPNAKITRVE